MLEVAQQRVAGGGDPDQQGRADVDARVVGEPREQVGAEDQLRSEGLVLGAHGLQDATLLGVAALLDGRPQAPVLSVGDRPDDAGQVLPPAAQAGPAGGVVEGRTSHGLDEAMRVPTQPVVDHVAHQEVDRPLRRRRLTRQARGGGHRWEGPRAHRVTVRG